eukprot:364273-Chlamydomonas_euryale.AAC.9
MAPPLGWACTGLHLAAQPGYICNTFKVQLDEVRKGHILTYLHKDLNKPLLLDVKHPPAGQAQGGAKKVIEQLKVPDVVVLLDACWFSLDEIASLKKRRLNSMQQIACFTGA